MKNKASNQIRWFSGLTRRTIPALLLTWAMIGLANLASAQSYLITNLWYVGMGTANLVADNNNRGLAYNELSNHVYVASRGSGTISVLDAASGSVIAANFPSITTFPYNVGVADDGVIYGVPLANGVNTANLAIYSWTNWTSNQRPCYTQVGSDIVSTSPLVQGQRVGDTFAIYGSGTNTLIALAINVNTSIASSTNILLFSTTDGQTFTPTLLSVAGLPFPNADQGPQHALVFIDSTNLLFRPGTAAGTSTYRIQFPANFASLPSPVAATVTATNTTLPSGSVYLFSYSPAGKLLADYGQIQNAIPSSTLLRLFDISGFPVASSLGSTSTPHTNATNPNLTGGVALGGQGKTNAVYVLDSNNGVWGFSLTFVAAATFPVITASPVGGIAYTNAGSFTFSASADGTTPLVYYWQYNTVSNLATASTVFTATNNGTYTINPLTFGASGWYNVIVSNVLGATNSLPVQLTVSTPTTSLAVTQLWTLPGGSRPYLGTTYNTRGMAYDPTTGTLVIATNGALFALSATDGSDLFQIDTPGVYGNGYQGWLFDQVGVADDGVVYAANLYGANSNPGGLGYSITRLSSVTASPGLYQAYGGVDGASDPGAGSGRWGDTMTVRGSGSGTEILIGSFNGTNVVLFTTANGFDFTPHLIAITNVSAAGGFAGQGIAFGAGDTFWAKTPPNYNLRLVSFDRTTSPWTGGVIQLFTAGVEFPASFGGIGVDVSSNILGGVNFSDTPDDVQLFLLSGNTNVPSLFNQSFFSSVNPNVQLNSVTTLKGGKGFALDVNNGIVAFSYSVAAAPAVTITSVTHTGGSSASGSTTLNWINAFNGHNYQVQSTPSLNPASWSNIGSPVLATGPSASYTDTPVGGATRFYRVISQ